MASKCTNCGKSVYPQEQVQAGEKKYHKGCFKCSVCNSTLSVSHFVGSSASGTFQIYCKVHAPKSGPQSAPSPTVAKKEEQQTTSPTPVKNATPVKQTTQTPVKTTQTPVKTTTQAPVKPTTQTPVKTTQTPVKTTTQAPTKTTTQAPTKTTTQTSNNNKKEDDKKYERPKDAAKFLKRTRHEFDFASKLTPQQLEDFKNLFKLFDKDGSGAVNIMELGNMLFKLGYDFSAESLSIIIRIVDENRDGQLNFQEFLGFYDFLDWLQGLFKSCDTDKSGTVDRRELNIMLKRAGYKFKPEQVELLYRMCDEDGSGTIELPDFLSLMLFVIFAQILFATADTDGNDSIDISEFQNLMQDLGLFMPPGEVIKFFQELDTDKSGTLSFEEYVELVFELKYPFISDVMKYEISQEGVADELKEEVVVNPDDKINLMEASGFLKRSRHRFDFQSKLSNEQIEDYKKLFKIYDKDGSGTVDIMELGSMLAKLGYTFSPDSLETIVHIVDDNMDGVLNFQEFLGLYDFLNYLKTLFDTADDDHNGYIERAELKSLLEKANYHFSEKQLELFYKMCDEDDDGQINVSDFFALTLFIFWAQILFAKADTDGNDVIDLTEFNNVMKRIGLPMNPDATVKFFTDLDTDKNGSLSFEEYIELIFMLKFLGF